MVIEAVAFFVSASLLFSVALNWLLWQKYQSAGSALYSLADALEQCQERLEDYEDAYGELPVE